MFNFLLNNEQTNFLSWIDISFILIFIFGLLFLFFIRSIFLYFYFSLSLILVGSIMLTFKYFAFKWFEIIRSIFFDIVSKESLFNFAFLTENYLLLQITFIIFSCLLLLIVSSIVYFLFLKRIFFLNLGFGKIRNFLLKLFMIPFLFLGLSSFYVPLNSMINKINLEQKNKLEKFKPHTFKLFKVLKILDIFEKESISIYKKNPNKLFDKAKNTESLLIFSEISKKWKQLLFYSEKEEFVENELKPLLKKYLPKNIFKKFEKSIVITPETEHTYTNNFNKFFNNKKYKEYFLMSLSLQENTE